MKKDHYQLEKELGQGGFATSWLARNTQTQAPCVLKKIHLAQLDTWKSLELFERECKTLKHLRHLGIPRFIDAWSDEGSSGSPPEAVLVQEYIPGKNLQQWLQDGRRFREAEACELALQLCEILSYLHSFSPPVVHRDIKPSNIILNQEQRVFLIDFGAVKQTLGSHSESVTLIGTFGYMPLEQMEGKSLPASDLYALGATLVFLLSGRSPAELERKNLKLDFRPHTQLSPRFNQILDKLLEPDLQKRYAHVAELQVDLLKLQQNQDAPFGFRAGAKAFWQRILTHQRLLLAGGGIIGLVLALVLLGNMSRQRSQAHQVQSPPAQTQPRRPDLAAPNELGWQKAPLAPFERYLPVPRLESLSEDPQGTVWGISSSALYAFADQAAPEQWGTEALTGGYASLKWLETGLRGEVWFGTYNGQLYRFAKGETEAIDRPDKANLTALAHFQNQMLAAYGKRLYRWNAPLGLFQIFKEFPQEISALHSKTAQEPSPEPSSVLWVGAKNQLYRYADQRWELLWQGKSEYDDAIRTLRATENHVYLGLEKSTLEWDRKRKTSAPLLRGGTAKFLEIQPKQAFWLGTADILSEGLYLRIPGSPTLYSLGYREGLPGDRFDALLLDSQKRLWLSFNYAGGGALWRAPVQAVQKQALSPKSRPLPAQHFQDACEAWSTLKPPASDQLAGDVFAKKTHVFWQQQLVCPFGDGFIRRDGVALLQNFQGLFLWRKHKLSHHKPPRNVYGSHSLLLDKDDQIWLARNHPYHVFRSQGSGPNSGQSHWQAQTEQEGLSGERAPLLYQTRKGQILAAVMVKYHLPLQIWDEAQMHWQTTALENPEMYLSATGLYELRSGKLALATDKGLFIVAADLKSAQSVEELPYKDIQAVAEDKQGQVWIIYNRFGAGRGLSVWNPQSETVRHLDSRSGLVPDRFQGLTIDAANRIWLMAGGMAVQVYAQQDLDKALKGP